MSGYLPLEGRHVPTYSDSLQADLGVDFTGVDGEIDHNLETGQEVERPPDMSGYRPCLGTDEQAFGAWIQGPPLLHSCFAEPGASDSANGSRHTTNTQPQTVTSTPKTHPQVSFSIIGAQFDHKGANRWTFACTPTYRDSSGQRSAGPTEPGINGVRPLTQHIVNLAGHHFQSHGARPLDQPMAADFSSNLGYARDGGLTVTVDPVNKWRSYAIRGGAKWRVESGRQTRLVSSKATVDESAPSDTP